MSSVPTSEGNLTETEKKFLQDQSDIEIYKEQENIHKEDPEDEYLKVKDREDSYNIIYEFLKQLSPQTELWRISVPAYILQPISLLEKISHYSSPNNTIEKINEEQSPEKRFISILAWVISNWRTIPRHGMQQSKPFNPVLGEIFKCEWTHGEGDVTKFLGEQVSHHPPVSAFCCHNEKRQFTYTGYVFPITSFSWNSVTTLMDGEFKITLGKFNEEYIVNHPPVSVSNVLWGSTVIEIYDYLKINCPKTGFNASIYFDYGKDNYLSGYIYDADGYKKHWIEGKVNQSVEIQDLSTKEKKLLYSVETLTRPPKTIRPVHEQEPRESRRNWHKAIYALKKEDFEEAQLQKHLVEERERAIRKERAEAGITWTPKYFVLEGEKRWVLKSLDCLK
ncbi:hypothetical protein FDP41_012219 [Naegleria fowleri]|uniref:Oxysterol-binding protein n=1 Tax=Naegleria fowleri TaxID=5763 RepID=A0A6A5C475_NAEFO|nr:uncharacterized protein FDP41_012219 [Naegleria fowleri]KAF0981562.1 hypothetical protein FDP41_012219 [Naegleria fowleri]CAG4718026.1 unnamed protein product [Naegleria fowleri]